MVSNFDTKKQKSWSQSQTNIMVLLTNIFSKHSIKFQPRLSSTNKCEISSWYHLYNRSKSKSKEFESQSQIVIPKAKSLSPSLKLRYRVKGYQKDRKLPFGAKRFLNPFCRRHGKIHKPLESGPRKSLQKACIFEKLVINISTIYLWNLYVWPWPYAITINI